MEDSGEEGVQIVVFRLAHLHCAFLGTAVKSIFTMQEIAPLPGAPERILGLAYLQGTIESVLDLKKVLGLKEAEPGREARIIVAEAAGLRSGIAVDAVEDVMPLPLSEVRSSFSHISEIKRDYIWAEANYKNGDMIILDLESLFSQELASL